MDVRATLGAGNRCARLREQPDSASAIAATQGSFRSPMNQIAASDSSIDRRGLRASPDQFPNGVWIRAVKLSQLGDYGNAEAIVHDAPRGRRPAR